jgi:hypothetical protein
MHYLGTKVEVLGFANDGAVKGAWTKVRFLESEPGGKTAGTVATVSTDLLRKKGRHEAAEGAESRATGRAWLRDVSRTSRQQAVQKIDVKVGDTVVFGSKNGAKTRGEVIGITSGGKVKVRTLEDRGVHKAGKGFWKVDPEGVTVVKKGR